VITGTDNLFGQWRRRGQCSQLHLGGSVSLRPGQRAFDRRPDAERRRHAGARIPDSEFL